MKETLAERRLEVVRRHMASENDHDFDTTMATFSHPRYELIPSGQVFDGEEEVRAYFAGSRTAFADQRNEPTGREIRVRMVAFFEFDAADGDHPDGIVCERVYYDLHTILTQLGLG